MPSVSSGLEGGQLLWEQGRLGMKEASTTGSSEWLHVEFMYLFYSGSSVTTHVFQQWLLCQARERVCVSRWADALALCSPLFSSALPREPSIHPSTIQSR